LKIREKSNKVLLLFNVNNAVTPGHRADTPSSTIVKNYTFNLSASLGKGNYYESE